MAKGLSESEMREELRRQCDAVGSIAAWARGHGLSSQFLNDVLHERRGVTEALADAMGYEKAPATYFKKKGTK